MMKDERITYHLQLLNNNLLELSKLGKIELDEFLSDDIKKYATERLFHTAIESCINIGNRIISIEQTRQPVKPPETYGDIAKLLFKLDVIDNTFEEKFINMIKFRNRLVHIYWEIDEKVLYDYLTNNLGDFKDFIKFVSKYIND